MSNVRRKNPVDDLRPYRNVHTETVQVPSESFITLPDVLIWVLCAGVLFIVVTIGRGIYGAFHYTANKIPEVASEITSIENLPKPGLIERRERERSANVDSHVQRRVSETDRALGTMADRTLSGISETIDNVSYELSELFNFKGQKKKKNVGNAFNR